MSRKNNVLQIASSRGTAKQPVKRPSPGPALDALMKFRLVINSTRRHYKWIERQTGINGALVWAMWELNHSPGLRVSELAVSMAIHQSTASNLLDKLEEKGLIERDRSNDDQRVVRLFLTRAGQQLIRRVPEPARGLLQEALFRIPAASLVLLNRVLDQVLKEMHPGNPGPMKKPLADSLS